MIYQSSSIRALLVLAACAVFLTIEAAPLQGQLVQLHPISRAQYEALLGPSIADTPAAVQGRHINYTIQNPLNGWTNDISHGWRYLLNKTGLYQKPEKPVVRDRGYKLCYVNPIYGGPNAGEGMGGRAAREVEVEAEERNVAIDAEDDAFDAHGKPIVVNYFPSPSVTCVWVRPEPTPTEPELCAGEATDVPCVPEVLPHYAAPPVVAGAYPYASVEPYTSTYGAYPYASAYSSYPYGSYPYGAYPYGSPPYASSYGRSNAKTNKKTAPFVARVDTKRQPSVNNINKSKDPQRKTQPKQQSRQFGTYGYGSPYGNPYGSPYGSSYGSPYGGYYGGLNNGAYGGGYGNAYGSPFVGVNPYAGFYGGGQSLGYPAYGHYDSEDSGENSGEANEDSEDSENSVEDDGGEEEYDE